MCNVLVKRKLGNKTDDVIGIPKEEGYKENGGYNCREYMTW